MYSTKFPQLENTTGEAGKSLEAVTKPVQTDANLAIHGISMSLSASLIVLSLQSTLPVLVKLVNAVVTCNQFKANSSYFTL